MDNMFGVHNNPWGPASAPQPGFYPPQPPPGFSTWGQAMPMNSTFGAQAPSSEPRYVVIRKMLCRACEQLGAVSRDAGGASNGLEGFASLDDVKAKFSQFQGGHVEEKELLDMCETEGNLHNGGGSFDLRDDSSGKKFIRWDPNSGRANPRPIQRAVGAPGEIGSPVVGSRPFGSSGR